MSDKQGEFLFIKKVKIQMKNCSQKLRVLLRKKEENISLTYLNKDAVIEFRIFFKNRNEIFSAKFV